MNHAIQYVFKYDTETVPQQSLTKNMVVSEGLNLHLALIDVNKNVSNLSKLQPSSLSFEKLLLEAVDQGFSMFGDLSKEAVYLHLVEAFNINKNEIPYKIEEFVNAIEKTFGFSAKILQIQILKHLHKKVGHGFKYHSKNGDLKLTDYVAALRQFFCSYY